MALDIQALLKRILDYRSSLDTTGLAYHASDEQKLIHADIDADKLVIIEKARNLAAQSKYPICLPDSLEIGYFGDAESASSPPRCTSGL